VIFEVTADGLSAIRFRGREVAHGGWSPFNAEPWFKDAGSGKVSAYKITERSIRVLDDHRARVRHVRGDLTCITDYDFQAEDVTISARVENGHATEPLNVTGFAGLTFAFDRPPTGLMPVQHISYFQAHGVGLCHPSHFSPIGGSYAADETIGVGVSPWNTGWTRSLILWDYADWNPDKRDKLPERRLLYFVVQPVPPRGAATFDLCLRISPSRDWKHLLEPYREHFRKTFGPVRYKADYRWIASDYLNHSQQAVSPTNPYGFHGGHRRIDRPEGVRAFCDAVVPSLVKGDGQGVIVWGQGGDDPRGAMYRPDFDVLPPPVEANWPNLARCFRKADRKLGVTTRPRHLALRQDWKVDEVLDINADDPGHRAMLWRRFEGMVRRGCTLFYLDSFGDSLEDVKLMRFLRQKLGPDILTFAEHQCDAILPFSGGYSETSLEADSASGAPRYRLWSGLENWELYQWLVPGAQMTSRLYEVKVKAPPGFDPSGAYFLRHRITPLVPVNDLAQAEDLGRLQKRYLDATGHKWR
jgi:hypothetical protein